MSDAVPAIEPLLAVVVLSVRAAPALAEAVRSLREQDTPIELVVVNSGGGDVLPLLPDGGQGIRVVTADSLLWPGAARNRGIEASRAPFVAFLASDCLAAPGWVSGRLRHHLQGAPAVASAIVNSAPQNAVATAYHLVHTASRDINVPAAKATRYGASYARWMFDRYGPFREDLRVAEDTEFHQRLQREHRPVWAPDVRTIHHNPVTLWAALRQHFERGQNRGRYWAEYQQHRLPRRIRKTVAALMRDLDRLIPKPLPASRSWMRAVVGASVLANQLGRAVGRRRASRVVALESAARTHGKGSRWQRAADKWAEAAAMASDARGPLRWQAIALTRTGHHSGAVAAYQRLVALDPTDCSHQVGLGHSLLAASSFDEALDVWRSAAARFGRRLPIVEGLAMTQLAAGNVEAAEQLYGELAANFAYSPSGRRGLAEAALARQDWSAALAHLTALGREYRDVSALDRAAEVSTYLGLDEDTDDILGQLQSIAGPTSTAYLAPRIRVLAARNDRLALLAFFKDHRRDVSRTPVLVAPMVDALNMAGQSQAAIALLDEAEKVTRRRYQGQRLATHLQAGQIDEALRVLEEIADVRTLSVSTFVALVDATYEKNGPDAATDLVGQAAGPRNRDALRVAALFEARRLRSLAALDQTPPRLIADHCEAQLAALLNGISARSDHLNDVALLREHCATFARLRAKHADFAPDPRFVAADAVKVAAAIASAVRKKRGFSLVRLGDGEGNALPYRPAYRGFEATDLAATQRVWWGRAEGETGPLETQLRLAISNADVVGIPDLFRLSYVTSPKALEGANGRSRNVRGLVAALDYGAKLDGPLITSCHIHQALGHWGLWDILLPQLGSVSLITCHEALGPALIRQFGLEIAALHLIPPEHKHAQKFSAPASVGRHYPDVFEALRQPLTHIPQGQVVLVAAGVLGKIYCNWIKAAGGIAIDVGSAADHWSGYVGSPGTELEFAL